MNLLATDRLEEILGAVGFRGLICPRTQSEAIYLNPRTVGAPLDPIDLGPYIDGALTKTALSREEIRLFVHLARQVDDGEAQVLAVCANRSLAVATDDRKAQRVATEMGLTVTTTPELVMAWAADVQPPSVAAAIADIEWRARFRPRPTDVARSDWDRLKAGETYARDST